MKKEISLTLISILVILTMFSMVRATDSAKLEVSPIDQKNTLISELNDTASYRLLITNNGQEDNYEIYSYVGFEIFPKEKFILKEGNNTLDIQVNPMQRIRDKYFNYTTFTYQLIGDKSGIYEDKLLIKLVPLKDAIELSSTIKPTDSEATLIIKNIEDTPISDLSINFDSLFFSGTKTLSLLPLEEKNITFPVDKGKTEKLKSGSYVVTGIVNINGKDITLSGIINYLENQSITVSQKDAGFIIRTESINKTNIGNTAVISSITISKNAFSRLFTTFSTAPASIKRSGLAVTYFWEKNLNPSESLSVTATTNYTLPFIIIILIIIIGFLAKIYAQTALSVNKRVSFVRTKGGEFALKVMINVKARKSVENVKLHDRIPAMSKLYEHFIKAPDAINHATNSLSWNLGNLNAGEERVFSYIIYNPKLKIVGRYELPRALATFTHNGKTKDINSNRAFFLSETVRSN